MYERIRSDDTYSLIALSRQNKKMYMLEGLEPSVELTGGAWYIDGELDTGLIHHLSEACLKVIREMVCYTLLARKASESIYRVFQNASKAKKGPYILYPIVRNTLMQRTSSSL
jgi:hypothetical protein